MLCTKKGVAMIISKTIIPAAGLGSRFLPYSKAVPKEMLPLLNKPAIHYIVEESVQAGLKNIVIISNRERQTISHYFDPIPELVTLLKENKKNELLVGLDKLIRTAHFTYVHQPEALGLGHAVLMAEHIVDPKEFIAVMLPDDIVIHSQPGIEQLAKVALQEKATVIAVQEVPNDCLSSYGVIAIKKQITPRLYQVGSLIEKPTSYDAPSNLAIIGRYILSAKIFPILAELTESDDQEVQLTDAIDNMIRSGEKVYAYKIQGTRFDIGTPTGWLKATIALALQHPEYAPHIRQFLNATDMFDSFQLNPIKNILHRI
jgi:UTP--glucose-1-phosphate uridylyltransferase